MDRTKKQLRTPISYYGGKQALLHHILPMIPRHEVYTEAFFGGGSVFWSKVPAPNETINDRLDIVINFYQQLKTNFKSLKFLIDQTLISRTQHIYAYRCMKGIVPADDVTRAWAFWMCSNFSFSNKLGGGIKYSNRQDTVPPITLQTKKREFTDHLVARIENAHIENNDAVKVLNSRNVPNAFHYIDPPYMNADQGHYKGYTPEDFKSLLQFCAGCKGKFLLSNYNSDALDKAVAEQGWRKKEITIRLQAKNTRFKEKNKTEVMVWNYNEREGQGSFF